MKPIISNEIADVVIIGGGILGCSTAYYLSRRHSGQVLLLERNQVAQANTSRAAGILETLRSRASMIPLVQETYRAIKDLEALLGENLGFHQVGCLHVAASSQTQADLLHLQEIAEIYKINIQAIELAEAQSMVPWLELQEIRSVVFTPEDGFIDPYRLAQAYAHAAALQGVSIRNNVAVQEILVSKNHIAGVLTDRGLISSPVVIDTAGVWAGLLAWKIGVPLPMAPVRSHYWITTPSRLFPADQPIVFLPDAKAYTRPEIGRLLIGLREKNGVSIDPLHLPDDLDGFRIGDMHDQWDCLIEGSVALKRFLPQLEQAKIAHYLAGLSNYTPDGLLILGGVSGLDGFWVASGCSGSGIAVSGGAGLAVAELVEGKACSFDLSSFQIERFGRINPFLEEFRLRCVAARYGKAFG